MSHIDLEQGTIGDRRLSSSTDGEYVVSSFCSHAFGYYDSDNDECSRSVSSVSKSEEGECSCSVSSVSKSEEGDKCRICQDGRVYGQGLIELGCSCKGDLAVAHRQCAETWFKLKGNEVCEICHSVARNVAGGNEMIEEDVAVAVEERGGGGDAAVGEDGESWCQGRQVLIILLILWVLPFLMFFLQSVLKN